jgi:copper chaperone CopZ
VRVSLKSVAGVESVDVSLEKGLATVKMKSGNTTRLKQLRDAITKDGFTMKQSKATVAGTILVANGKTLLKISGSNDVLQLVRESQSVPAASAMQGNSVVVVGSIPETAKDESPDSLTYHSLMEEPSK